MLIIRRLPFTFAQIGLDILDSITHPILLMNQIEISSRAMFSSWAWHHPTRTLFDCGESVSLVLGSRIFGVSQIAIGHGHGDHIGGLFTLIGLRAKLKGATGKALEILYPADNLQFALVRQYINKSWPALPYKLTWSPIVPGHKLVLDKSHTLEAFAMAHQPRATTLGYKITEQRSRLTVAWRDRVKAMPQAQIGPALAAARGAGEVVDEVYHASSLAYCLDNCGFDYEQVRDAALVIADCTFIDELDRNEDPKHATLRESAERCRAVGVKHMVAAHLSVRYHWPKVVEAVDLAQKELDIPITLCPTDRVLSL